MQTFTRKDLSSIKKEDQEVGLFRRFRQYRYHIIVVLTLLFFLLIVSALLGVVGQVFSHINSSIVPPDSITLDDEFTEVEKSPTPHPDLRRLRNKRTTFLLIGIDRRDDMKPEQSLADSIMVLSIYPPEKSVVMLSIPRDLQVEFPRKGDYLKINAVHNHPSVIKRLAGGPRALKSVVENVTGIEIDYFLRIDFFGFEKIIDELGGIEVDVPDELIDREYPTDRYGLQTIRIPAGKQVMNGKTALQYARSRHADNPLLRGDVSRSQRQQQVILATKERALSSSMDILSNPLKIKSLLSVLSESFLTDIQFSQMILFAQLATEFKREEMHVSSKVIEEGVFLVGGRVHDGGEWRYFPIDKTWKEIHHWADMVLKFPTLCDDIAQEGAEVFFINASPYKGVTAQIASFFKRVYKLDTKVSSAKSIELEKAKIVDFTKGYKASTVKFFQEFFNIDTVELGEEPRTNASPVIPSPEEGTSVPLVPASKKIEIYLGEDSIEMLKDKGIIK